MLKKYEILYTKDNTKKKKLFHDGIIILIKKEGINNINLILLDEIGKELIKRNYTIEQLNDFQIGNEFTIGQYLIQIEKEKEVNSTQNTTSTSQNNLDINNEEEEEDIKTNLKTPPAMKKPLHLSLTKSISRSLSNRLSTTPVSNLPAPISREIDPSLLRVMRAHQVLFQLSFF